MAILLPSEDMTISTKVADIEGRTYFGRSQDCSAIVEDVKARQSHGMTGSSEMKHAARIPTIVVEKYCNDHDISFHEFMANREHIRRVLNDPSLSAFRIWRGQV